MKVLFQLSEEVEVSENKKTKEIIEERDYFPSKGIEETLKINGEQKTFMVQTGFPVNGKNGIGWKAILGLT